MKSPQVAADLEALTYEAPYLIEKLVKDHIVETAEEGQALFAEVKKYIILVRSDQTTLWDMYSLRIDEVWHQFILFTHEYTNYCRRFVGDYVSHSPSNAPKPASLQVGKAISSFVKFQERYAALFGYRLPDAWYDELSITSDRRVLNNFAGCLKIQDANGMVDLVNERGDAVLSVNKLARTALTFITMTGAFYVRELPGELTDEEKVALIATLVEYGLCRVAA